MQQPVGFGVLGISPTLCLLLGQVLLLSQIDVCDYCLWTNFQTEQTNIRLCPPIADLPRRFDPSLPSFLPDNCTSHHNVSIMHFS
jgi:hypothetical protein